MGGWCGAERPTPRARKHGCVCGHKSGVEIALTERNGKKWSKVAGGRVLSLDKSLLYGCISYPPRNVRVKERRVPKHKLRPYIRVQRPIPILHKIERTVFDHN